MARSQRKMKATKPPMIRGDRLLLALRVMYHCAVPRRGDGLSIKKIHRTLQKTFRHDHILTSTIHDVPPLKFRTQEVTVRLLSRSIGQPPLDFLHRFIAANPNLARTILNVDAFLYKTHEGDIRLFFERIASGELTEEDFREVAR